MSPCRSHSDCRLLNVAPGGSPVAVSDVMASPSASTAVTLTWTCEFSFTVLVAGAVRTGARSVFVTVMTVVFGS
jgi:hypothetical protein